MGRDTVQAHLAALDLVYDGVIADTRNAIDETDDLDPVTNDMLIGHAAELEKFQWFVRARTWKTPAAPSSTMEYRRKRAPPAQPR